MKSAFEGNVNFDRAVAEFAFVGTFLDELVAGQAIIDRSPEPVQIALAHARRKAALFQSSRPDRARVLVLGEFKAGKSTLINALVGSQFAAVVTSKMTHAVCEIVPTSDREHFRFSLSDGQGAFTMSPAQFLPASDDGSFGLITRVQVFVSTELDVVLVDTPGLGASIGNEITALDALTTTDIVLYTIDAENVGGARDAALLGRMREIGLPIRCILTKSDSLDANEIAELTHYVVDEYGIPDTSIFVVSAVRALLGHRDPGVELLKRHLTIDIAPRARALREEAMAAQAVEIAMHFKLGLDGICSDVDEGIADVDAYYLSLQERAAAVTLQLCNAARTALDALFQPQMKTILRSYGSECPPSLDVNRRPDSVLNEVAGESFAADLEQLLGSRLENQWIAGITATTEQFSTAMESMEREADEPTIREFHHTYYREMLKKHATTAAVAEAMMRIGAITCLGSGVELLSVAPFTYVRNEKAKAPGVALKEEHWAELARQVARWRDANVQEIITTRLRPNIEQINAEIALDARDCYATSRQGWPMSYEALVRLRDECGALRSAMDSYRPKAAGGMAAVTDRKPTAARSDVAARAPGITASRMAETQVMETNSAVGRTANAPGPAARPTPTAPPADGAYSVAKKDFTARSGESEAGSTAAEAEAWPPVPPAVSSQHGPSMADSDEMLFARHATAAAPISAVQEALPVERSAAGIEPFLPVVSAADPVTSLPPAAGRQPTHEPARAGEAPHAPARRSNDDGEDECEAIFAMLEADRKNAHSKQH